MKSTIYLAFIITTLAFLTSCEDVVDIPLEDAEPRLVVDAWIDNSPKAQEIRLTLSQPYFDAQPAEGIQEATVRVLRQDSTEFTFNHVGDGLYRWEPNTELRSLGDPMDRFTLFIEYDGEVYASSTTLFPSTPIDYIDQYEISGEIGNADGTYATFFARDLPGRGDCYWIKAYKNGVFLNRPGEINIAFDAGFDPGGDLDNLVFITPIRESINPLPDGDLTEDVSPYATGDEVRVEIHSMSFEAFNYMQIVRDQLLNGDNGIFAFPLANARGNIRCTTCEKPVLGLFNVAMVTSEEYTIQ